MTAEGYLSRLVLRDKVLSSNETCASCATTAAKPAEDKATTNVIARIYNSNPVKSCVSKFLPKLKQIVEGTQPFSEPTSTPATAKDVASEEANSVRSVASKDQLQDGEHAPSIPRSANGPSDEGTLQPPGNQPSGRTTNSPLQIEHQSQSQDDDNTDLSDDSASGSNVIGASDIEDLSVSMSEGYESEVATARHPDEPAPKKSAYLPSLTMAGYASGGDSEDADDALMEDTHQSKRNRRGQRARQQIWEKKFGTQAKHLHKPSASGRGGRDEGWDLKRGAKESAPSKTPRVAYSGRSKNGSNQQSRPTSTSKSQGQPVQSREAAPRKSRDDQGPLHPSWQAAKKIKEQKAAFTGTKISFD